MPILAFFISMNATFAYFTSSVDFGESTSQAGIIKIKITDDTAWKVNSASISASTKLIPGDTLNVEGTVENAGNAQFYAILQLKIDVTKSGETTAETVSNKYYTYSGTTLKEIAVIGDGSVTATAFIVDAPNANKTNTYTKAFSIPYTFDFYKFNNSYKNAKVNYYVYAHAIQTKNLTDTTSVTKMLMGEILPLEYQQVEYIESTGTQFIDTGVIGKNGVKMIANINVSALPTKASPFCGSYGNNQRCYLIIVQPDGRIGMSYKQSTYATYTLNVDKKYKIETDFTLGQQGLKVDDELILSNNNSVELNTGNNIFLFGYNHTDYVGLDTNYPVMFKLYDFKLYDNGTLVRDFVPCIRKSDNEIGLYDKVNNVFYTNSGSGSFLKGANV